MKTIKIFHKKNPIEIQVDNEDYTRAKDIAWHVCVRDNGSTKTINAKIDNKTISIANFIMNDYDHMFDHIDGNPLNNQKLNLRICLHHQNQWNKGPQLGRQFKGASYNKRRNAWEAYIMVLYKKIHLGFHKTEIEAAKAYNKAAIRHYGEFARLNEIPNDFPVSKIQETSSTDEKSTDQEVN